MAIAVGQKLPEAVLITMGAPATQNLLSQKDGILRLRGRWFEYKCAERHIPALATLHPAYLLRQPGQKSLAWRDLPDFCPQKEP